MARPMAIAGRSGKYIGLPSRFLYGAIEGNEPRASAR
jgi:hypothetical protein